MRLITTFAGMSEQKKPAKTALISVFYKDGLAAIAKKLHALDVTIYSTGGTEKFIRELGIPVIPVEDITGFPEILGGRVKTLHPAIFGGILFRRSLPGDLQEVRAHEIPALDMVIVDLYPFEQTVAGGGTEQEIIEKIDVGGVSLIRAAAKNFQDVLIVSDRADYPEVIQWLDTDQNNTSLSFRKYFAGKAFQVIAKYDATIAAYFAGTTQAPAAQQTVLRYGENPHQKGVFSGSLDAFFDKLHGKELSYNNILDIDAGLKLMTEFKDETCFAVIKHTNTCGLAIGKTLQEAYLRALACDPTSAFGGILICNKPMDDATAEEIDKLFCEVVIAPDYTQNSLSILQSKKNRILLKQKIFDIPDLQVRSALNGSLLQDFDKAMESREQFTAVTHKKATHSELEDLEFALKACKHLKSNTITLVKDKQLIGMGCGQTSRVDALKQAIEKAKSFGFSLQGAVMASDAFFPFPDCVDIAHQEGITAVVQPGGSINDKLSIQYCDEHNMAMVTTGVRHFKH